MRIFEVVFVNGYTDIQFANSEVSIRQKFPGIVARVTEIVIH